MFFNVTLKTVNKPDFIKIPFINKGIESIDSQSIVKDN